MNVSIKQLQPDVSKLITSSQVITSPSSVVKELLENSLDASATNIDIKLESFGFDRIEVRDNGCGVDLNEVQYMAMSHYTSKISCQNDLDHISTYGFRGEALSSICNVGQVTISTRNQEEIGAIYQLDHEGKVISQCPCSLNQGTCVVVNKLFSNLPVRKQYYNAVEKKKEELKLTEDILKAYALIRPEIRLCLYHNKCLIWQKGRTNDMKSSGQQVFGFSVMKHLNEIKYNSPDNKVSITALLPKSHSNSQVTGRLQSDLAFLFVNKRPVKLKKMLKVIKHYYSHGHNLLGSQMKYPVCCFSIEVPPETIDVNVDPNKEQVFFHNQEDVLKAMESLLENVYGKIPRTKENTNENSLIELDTELSVLGDDNSCIFNADADELLNSLQTDDNNVVTHSIFEEPSATCVSSNVHRRSTNTSSSKDHFKPVPPDLIELNVATNSAVNASTGSCVVTGNVTNATITPLTSKDVDSSSGNHCDQVISVSGHQFSSADWSRGCIYNGSNELIEPQKILVGAGKRFASPEEIANGLKVIERPMIKKKKILSDDSHNMTLDGFFQSSTADFNQDTSDDKDKQPCKITTKKSRKNDIGASNKKIQTPSSQSKIQALNYKKSLVEMVQRVAAAATSAERVPPISQSSVVIKYNFEEIKSDITEYETFLSQAFSQTAKETTVIGKLNEYWIVCRESKLNVIHHHRINEVLLYNQLMKEHKVASCPLNSPIVLTESLLGEKEWATLLHVMSMYVGSDSISSIADERISSNGFTIKQIKNVHTNSSLIHLVAMADHIPFYGVADLKECLQKLSVDWSSTLADTRPVKIMHYLKSEAMRMAHGQPKHCTQQELLDLLVKVDDLMTNGSNECLHGKPLFYTLCNLNELEID